MQKFNKVLGSRSYATMSTALKLLLLRRAGRRRDFDPGATTVAAFAVDIQSSPDGAFFAFVPVGSAMMASAFFPALGCGNREVVGDIGRTRRTGLGEDGS